MKCPALWNKLLWLSRILAFGLTLGCWGTLHAECSDDLQQEKLRVGLIRSAFTGFNPADAEAAFKVLAHTLGQTHGYKVNVTVNTLENALDLDAMPAEQRPDLVVLDSWTYLEMRDAHWLKPVFVDSDRGQVAKRFLLLVRKDRHYKALADLRGKSLNLFFVLQAGLGDHWLRVLLQRHNLGSPEEFFGRREKHAEPMRTLLPVFFGQRDAALIDSSRFQLMTELNPQLKELQTLSFSEPLVNVIICIRNAKWPSEAFKTDLLRALSTLHETPAGQQILTLFKTDQVVPFEADFLETVRKLHRQHRSGALKTGPISAGKPSQTTPRKG